MTVRRVTEPAELPVTLAEAKLHLRVDSSDEDSFINGLIEAAVAHFDGLGVLGRCMVTQTWAQWFGFSPRWVRLRMTPFQSLSAVEYYDQDNVLQTAPIGDFEVRLDGDFVLVGPVKNAAWPTTYNRSDAVKLTYVAGYGGAADVPRSIKHAILLTIGHWYEHREAVAEGNFKELPLAVDTLLGCERVGWYG